MIFSFGKKESCDTCQALREEHKIALGNLKEQFALQIESLREQLAAERTEKNLLLHTMLEERKPKGIPTPVQPDEPVIIRSKTWDIKRAELEKQSREEAIRLAQVKRAEEIAKLERETGIAGNSDDLSVRMTNAVE